MFSMPGPEAEDSQNMSVSGEVNLIAGSSPMGSSCDPGIPSSHGLPPAATRTKKRKNSNEDYDDFISSEVESNRKERLVSRKVSATTAANP